MPLHNWSKTLNFIVNNVIAPTNIDQLIDAINTARTAQTTIKAMGQRHSFSELLSGIDTLIDCKHFNELSIIDDNHLRVGSGIVLNQLLHFLDQHQRSLNIISDITSQQVVGAMVSGTHGASLHQPVMADCITAIEMIDGNGELRRLTNNNLLNASKINLGLLGVITAIELNTIKKQTLQQSQQRMNNAQWPSQLNTLFNQHSFAKINWHANQDYADVTTCNPINHESSNIHTGDMQSLLCCDQIPISITAEYFIDIMQAQPICQQIVDTNWPEGLLFCLRPVAADNIWLSPCYQQKSLAIACVIFSNQDPMPAALQSFNRMMHQHSARPHWAKLCQQDSLDLSQTFPQIKPFNQWRQQCDPNNIFLNPTLRRWLCQA